MEMGLFTIARSLTGPIAAQEGWAMVAKKRAVIEVYELLLAMTAREAVRKWGWIDG